VVRKNYSGFLTVETTLLGLALNDDSKKSLFSILKSISNNKYKTKLWHILKMA
jgi:hypothetical protein